MRSRLLAAAVVTTIGCCACTVVGDDTRTKLALAVEHGMTEQQVLGLLGPPAKTGKPSGACTQGCVREMLYQTR